MKDVRVFRSYADDANFERVELVTRIYRYYTNPSNFEAVEAYDLDDGDKLLRWTAMGTGAWFHPRAEISDGKIIVRPMPLGFMSLTSSEYTRIVKDGRGLPVEFEK